MDLEALMAEKDSSSLPLTGELLCFIWEAILFRARCRFGSDQPMASWVGRDASLAYLIFGFISESLLRVPAWWQGSPRDWERNALPQTGLCLKKTMKQTTLVTLFWCPSPWPPPASTSSPFLRVSFSPFALPSNSAWTKSIALALESPDLSATLIIEGEQGANICWVSMVISPC